MQFNARVLEEKGLQLPQPPQPVGSYVQCIRTGNLLHLSGGISVDGEGAFYGNLAVIKAELGSFEPITRIVAVNGFVNCVPEFTDQAKVLNGASDLLVELFGPEAAHSRSAVGVASLPLGVAVEINMIVEFDPSRL